VGANNGVGGAWTGVDVLKDAALVSGPVGASPDDSDLVTDQKTGARGAVPHHPPADLGARRAEVCRL
jgi:hypothetical protein